MTALQQERPWWTRAANPKCRPWCQDEHRDQEFTEGGALTCSITLDEDDWFSVYVLQTTTVDVAETPGVTELTTAGVYHWLRNDEWTADQAERYARALLAAAEFARTENVAPAPSQTSGGIICPSWCVVPATAHMADLGDFDGRVIHHSREVLHWSLLSVTRPDGTWWPGGNGVGDDSPVQVMRDEDHAGDLAELKAIAATRQDEANGLAELLRLARA